MAKWLSELTPEFYIFLSLFFVLLILMVVLLIIIKRVNERVGSQDFEILESIAEHDKKYFYYITVVNKSLSPNFINQIGFIRGNVRHILEDKNNPIAPRNKYQTKILMDEILTITNHNIKKFKKVVLFAENEIGLRKKLKPKRLNKFLKREYILDKKEKSLTRKKERFDTGSYNFWERSLLIIKLLFRPFYKLHQRLKFSTNKVLKEAEIRRIQKAEHDRIEFKLHETAAKVNELRVKEETSRENRTRETELELLKQQKAYEIESLKQAELNKIFEKEKAKISAINVKEEVKKYFREKPISFNKAEHDLEKEQQQALEPEPPQEKLVEEKATVEEEGIFNIEAGKQKETIDYEALTVVELKEIAKENGLTNYSSLRKRELIALIRTTKEG